MFSAFKKLVGNDSVENNNGSKARQGQPAAIDRNLQKMFSKGVHYNMKIVIKGDRNVGKTCLWRRLQGQKFESEYVPTDEIQVCHIQWSYKATDDIVKVEIWDVVDKGKKRRPLDGLKFNGGAQVVVSEVETALDAEFIDVYKGTNGVIMMLDMTKQWTFDYVQREIVKIPEHIPVLVLANHLDMKHHRVVSEDQVKFFIESLGRSGAPVRYAESSMSNGFGLRFLHKFFNVPFLQLQREALLGQLERNQREIEATCEELDLLLESDEANYDLFVDRLGQRRRQVADSCANIAMMPGAAPGKITGGGVLPSKLPKSVSLPAEITNTILNKGQTPAKKEKTPPKPAPVQPSAGTDDYVSEAIGNGGDLNKFLEDAADDGTQTKEPIPESESEDEAVNGNPMVSGFQDDLDPEDLLSTPAPQPVEKTALAIKENTPSPDSRASSVRDFHADLRLEREDPDGTSSPAEWQSHDIDELEKKAFEKLSSDDEKIEVAEIPTENDDEKERKKSRPKSTKKSKKDKEKDKDKSEKKIKKKSKKKKEPVADLVEEDPLEAFLNDRTQYEAI